MQTKTICPDCGPIPVNHTVEWLSALFDWLFSPFSNIADALWRKIAPLFSGLHGEKMIPPLFWALASLGLGKILADPDEKDLMRTRCVWKEAEKRGVQMWEFRPFNARKDLFVAQYKDEVRVFDGLPRPRGAYSKGLLWMDDKGIMKRKFEAAGIPVARGGACFTKSRALEIFQSISPPVVVKPRTGSRSRHTTTHIINRDGLMRAFSIAKQLSPWVVVEEELDGMVFRGTIVGNTVVGIIRRELPQIVGDGRRTIHELVKEENKNPLRHGPVFHEIPINDEAETELARQGLTERSIPAQGQSVTLNQKVGRGSGGTTTDVTDRAHPENISLLLHVREVVGDPLIGVDFVINDIEKSWRNQKRCGIIECNSLPFLDLHHYPFSGRPRNAAGALWDMIFPDSSFSTIQSPKSSRNSSRRASIPRSSK